MTSDYGTTLRVKLIFFSYRIFHPRGEFRALGPRIFIQTNFLINKVKSITDNK